MGEQRDRAKADARAKKGHGDTQVYRQVADAVGGQVEFTGYDQTVTDATVRGIIRGDEVVERVGAGEEIEIVLDRTPLYAESGGRFGGPRLHLAFNGRAPRGERRAAAHHRARRAPRARARGRGGDGEGAEAVVDVARRRSISRAHTATHMVHQALRDELGDGPRRFELARRLRFDFKAT